MSKIDRHLSDMASMFFDVKTLLSGREEFHFPALTDPRRILLVNRKSWSPWSPFSLILHTYFFIDALRGSYPSFLGLSAARWKIAHKASSLTTLGWPEGVSEKIE